MLNSDDLKDSHFLVRLIPFIFAILSLSGFYLAITNSEEVCRAHVHRAFLLGWASLMFSGFAGLYTPMGDALAIAHTSVILYIILPFDVILESIGSLRVRVTGNNNVKHELPRWEVEKP